MFCWRSASLLRGFTCCTDGLKINLPTFARRRIDFRFCCWKLKRNSHLFLFSIVLQWWNKDYELKHNLFFCHGRNAPWIWVSRKNVENKQNSEHVQYKYTLCFPYRLIHIKADRKTIIFEKVLNSKLIFQQIYWIHCHNNL